MARIFKRDNVKLICAFTYNDISLFTESIKLLEKEYGKVELGGEEYDFNFSEYYSDEMGQGLKKKIVCFKALVNRSVLSDVKILTNKIESDLMVNGKRRINIDPGYLTLHNLVLASCKELPHRIFIGKDIFAEVTLTFKGNEFVDEKTTFEDYKQPLVKQFLKKVRESLHQEIKSSNR